MNTRTRILCWFLGLLVLPVVIIWCVVAQPVFTSKGRSKAVVNPESLRKHVVAFSQDFVPRSYDDAGNMARCVAYISGCFRQTGAVVTNQAYVAYRKTPCQNIIALFPGQDTQRVVIGAHYDAVPGTPGADDNASGVAGLLANFIGVVGDLSQRPLIRTVKSQMQGSTDLLVRSVSVPSFLPGVDYSDHKNYWENNFPAVMITDTAFYRNRRYHSPDDTADRLDYKRMSDVVVGVYEAVVALASGE